MLRHIPTYLIGGPLGAGKTTLLRHLLEQRPEPERWAVLINEFGAVGIDAALLGEETGVQIAEIPGGCLCCVNGLPFQVGLGRLLRRARPDRLLIETSGLGHPAALLEQLQASPWDGVLDIQALIMVLDARALSSGASLPTSQAEALGLADMLILNKSHGLAEQDRAVVAARLPARPLYWCEQGRIDWPLLHQPAAERPLAKSGPLPPSTQAPIGHLWLDPQAWECHTREHDGWLSVGWLCHPARRFDACRLDAWLGAQTFSRAKGLLHTDQGWRRINALVAGERIWLAAAAGRSSRLELLFQSPVDIAALDQGLREASSTD